MAKVQALIWASNIMRQILLAGLGRILPVIGAYLGGGIFLSGRDSRVRYDSFFAPTYVSKI